MIWLSRNIIYQMQIKPDSDDELIINSNDLVQERMEELQREMEQKAKEEAFRQMMEPRPVLDEEGNPVLDEEGNPVVEVPDPSEFEVQEEEPQIDYAEQAREEAEMILNQARMEADSILQDAMNQAEEMRSNAVASGHDEGYRDGMARATQEMEMARAEIQAERDQMNAELKDRQQGMGHDLVDVITEVVEKVFLVQFADKKEIVLHLVDNALSNIEGSKIFQIKVSEYNYEFLENNKVDLQDRVGSDVQVDIVLDPLLDQSQCIIETDGGIFDCSLGVQLENLIKDLRSLS